MRADELPNAFFGVRPDSPTGTQPFDQPPILRGEDAKPVFADPRIPHERIYFGE